MFYYTLTSLVMIFTNNENFQEYNPCGWQELLFPEG
jgi:hypothetical protein